MIQIERIRADIEAIARFTEPPGTGASRGGGSRSACDFGAGARGGSRKGVANASGIPPRKLPVSRSIPK